MQSWHRIGSLSLCAWALATAGCDDDLTFTRSRVLGGVKVSAEVLEAGKDSYTHYCRACHGDQGDGKGPSASGLRPPPRDFTEGKFKFAAVASGALPSDDDLRRIVRRGLHGTAMLAWDVPEPELEHIIQYIKTFSPKWAKGSPGKPIVTPADPWQADEAAAVARGRELYHVTAQCAGCHPNYATRADLAAMTLRIKKFQVTSFRDDMYGAVLKQSEYRATVFAKGEPHHAAREAEKPPDTVTLSILPPDFLRDELRSGDAPADLYRTIAAGVGGTAMPAWSATPAYSDPSTGEHWDGEKDIWALAHFVRSLVVSKGTPLAAELHQRLASQPAWSPSP